MSCLSKARGVSADVHTCCCWCRIRTHLLEICLKVKISRNLSMLPGCQWVLMDVHAKCVIRYVSSTCMVCCRNIMLIKRVVITCYSIQRLYLSSHVAETLCKHQSRTSASSLSSLTCRSEPPLTGIPLIVRTISGLLLVDTQPCSQAR